MIKYSDDLVLKSKLYFGQSISVLMQCIAILL